MKRVICLILGLVMGTSCETDREEVLVVYQVSNAYSPVNLKYRDSEGVMICETIDFQSVEDIWKYEFEEKRGEIVYLAARYTDSTSSVKLIIIVDGKSYKQGSSVNEPDKYVTVSGTIPY